MNRPGCNWGCLAIDVAAFFVMRALAAGLVAMAAAACG